MLRSFPKITHEDIHKSKNFYIDLKLTCNYKIYLTLFNGNNTDDFQRYTDVPNYTHNNLFFYF